MIVKLASKYKSDFVVQLDGYEINGKSIIGVMTLAAEQGSTLTLMFEGEDEEEAAAAVGELFEKHFDEA